MYGGPAEDPQQNAAEKNEFTDDLPVACSGTGQQHQKEEQGHGIADQVAQVPVEKGHRWNADQPRQASRDKPEVEQIHRQDDIDQEHRPD